MSTKLNLFSDCFTDCIDNNQFYFGIKSNTRNGKYKDCRNLYYQHSIVTICSFHSMEHCYRVNNYELCDVPQCSTIDYGNKNKNDKFILKNFLFI